MFKHYERAKDENGEYIKFHNQSIDPTRTHLNYNLAPERNQNQGGFVRQRCEEVYCLNRKDVNVMCSWVITAPQDLPGKDLKQFFQASYDFMAERYGQENVISSYVHMDECSPHMHFAFVPVIYDKKKNRLKVSAKDVINRTELQTFHKELQAHVEKVLGYEVSILNGATINGNKSINELKRETALEAQKSVSKACLLEEAWSIKLKALEMEYGAIKGFLKADNSMLPKQMYPPNVQVLEKGLLKKEKIVQVPQGMWEALWKSADTEQRTYRAIYEFEKSMAAFQNKIDEKVKTVDVHLKAARSKIQQLEKENTQLRSQLKESNAELKELKKNFEVTLDWIHSDTSFVESYYSYKKQREEQEKAKRNKKEKFELNFEKNLYFDNRPAKSKNRGLEL